MAVNPDINSWLEEELREQYQHDRSSVDPDWKQVFEQNGTPERAHRNGGAATPVGPPAYKPADGEELAPLRGAAARIAENMAASVVTRSEVVGTCAAAGAHSRKAKIVGQRIAH